MPAFVRSSDLPEIFVTGDFCCTACFDYCNRIEQTADINPPSIGLSFPLICLATTVYINYYSIVEAFLVDIPVTTATHFCLAPGCSS